MTLEELQDWDKRIFEIAKSLGLNCFPQEFEICDHFEMLGYMSYSGMPSRYPHWSFGKSYEREKTMYDCLLYTSPSPRDRTRSRMPSSA